MIPSLKREQSDQTSILLPSHLSFLISIAFRNLDFQLRHPAFQAREVRRAFSQNKADSQSAASQMPNFEIHHQRYREVNSQHHVAETTMFRVDMHVRDMETLESCAEAAIEGDRTKQLSQEAQLERSILEEEEHLRARHI